MGPPEDSLNAKLKRLRREGSAVAPAVKSSGPKPPASPALLRLRQRLRTRGAAYSEEVGEENGLRTLGMPDQLTATDTPGGIIHGRTRVLLQDHLHGSWRLDEAWNVNSRSFSLLTQDKALGSVVARDAIFLDTETTGLSGGSGTWVYMVGLGRFLKDGSFEVWQGFLRGPEGEKPFLAEVLRRIGEARSLVSFFGKSYDQHRLLDRFRLQGFASPFEGRPHLDLYHPLKRICGGQGGSPYGDHKLQTLEHHLCGLTRTDDLPGSAAPEAWFDFLGDRPHRLEGVFEHNYLDVLSLVTLFGHLGRSLNGFRADGGELAGSVSLRRIALARALMGKGEPEGALVFLDQASPRDTSWEEALLLERLRGECLLLVGDRAGGESLLTRVQARAQAGCSTSKVSSRVPLEASQLLARSALSRDDVSLAREAIGWAADWLVRAPALARHRQQQQILEGRLQRKTRPQGLGA